MKKIIATIMVMAATPAIAETTQDHYKQVIVQKPYTVQVCTEGKPAQHRDRACYRQCYRACPGIRCRRQHSVHQYGLEEK